MSRSDEQLNSLISSLTERFQKRLEELGETDPEKLLLETSKKKKEFLNSFCQKNRKKDCQRTEKKEVKQQDCV